ncbi:MULTISPECIES: amino acid permease [Methanobacterium]|uniref:Amino acid permease n=1 Tax=Methanobacterium bryantii TaxID=2161 RepID=A0A2A2H807_METBR|nr:MULTISPECIES: amino acid permease [Methanobacterium]OEC85366.1 amino acid permease [Methanobacterium sp. A39]PAV05400.1 amino acid permease [Methanobacterium bryantii]
MNINIFRKKSINDLLTVDKSSKSLKRAIGPLSLIIMGLGCIIGAGIFIVTGIASANYSGPALVLSFVISAVACIFTALCYAEFASMVPISGSVYTYTYVAMGEVWAWMIGWVLIFEYLISASAVAVGWSSYIVGLLNSTGFILPQIITNPPGIGLINLPAFLIIALLTGILILGTKESARFNAVIVLINVSIILLFIIVGANFINPANYHPFMPYGWTGVVQGAAMVFFAYIGFDAVSTAAEETKNPQRTLPIGIIGSLIISSILYIAVAAVLNGIVPYNLLNNAAPVTFALEKVGANWTASIVSFGALFGLTSVLLTSLFGQTRIFYSMSRDGLLPGVFSKIHPNFRSPVLSTIIVGAVASIIAAFLPLSIIIELVNIGTLSAFIFLALSIIILRKQQPDIERKFKCPLVPVIPVLSIIFCVFLIFQLSITTLERFAVSLIIGLTVYFAYGSRKSRLRNKRTVKKEDEFYELKGYKFYNSK